MRTHLTKAQWDRVAERIMELGNFSFIGLVITQIVPGGTFNVTIAFFGIVVLLVAYWIAYLIMKGGSRK